MIVGGRWRVNWGRQVVHDTPFWELDHTGDRCFRVADAHLNHFELRISETRAELWASDYDDPSTLKLRTSVAVLDLPFERGYVHFQHGQYMVEHARTACARREPVRPIRGI